MKSILHRNPSVNCLAAFEGVDYHCSMKENATGSRVFIAGPPCSGKTESGRILALLLRVPFIDLDRRISSAAGMPVPGIFESFGEGGFRDLETRELEAVTSMEGGFVTALGGGCLLSERNMRLVTASAVLLSLTAEEDVLVERWRGQKGERPLSMDEASFRALLRRRRTHYSSMPNAVDTSSLTQEEAAEHMMEMLEKGKEN